MIGESPNRRMGCRPWGNGGIIPPAEQHAGNVAQATWSIIMKKLLTILAVAVACTALACEKKSDQVIRPTKFDPDLDGPPSRLEKPLNEDIAKDQRRIAREAGRAVAPVGSPPATPAPAAPAAGGATDEVKQIVARMMTTIKPGQEEKALDFLDCAGSVSDPAALQEHPADQRQGPAA